MNLNNLNNFIGGWICGNFYPSLFKTTDFEVAIKRYSKGDIDSKHYHKKAIEYTVIVEGVVKMNDIIYKKDDIITIEKYEAVLFECIEDAITVVIKTPSVLNDKFLEI